MNKKINIAREISWLSFNARVLQEADDPALPVKDRIRFLGIYSNNSDEFFKVRVAVLKKMIQFNDKKDKPYLGKNPQKIFDQVHGIILQQQKEFNRIWKKITLELKREKVFLIDDKHLNRKQKIFVRNYFDQEVSSSIIPLFVENMPQHSCIGGDNIFLGIVMYKAGAASGNDSPRHSEQKFAIIEIPTKNHSRFVSLPSDTSEQNIMLLENVIRFNLPRIFSHLGYTHFEAHTFKVTQDAEIDVDYDVPTTFIQKIENVGKNRRKAPAVRFVYDKNMNVELLEYLIRKLNLSRRDSIIPAGNIRNFRDFRDFPAKLPSCQGRRPAFKHPLLAKALRVSEVIGQRDVLLHFPYHSFNSIIDLLREAAMDSDVKVIKITGYRLAENSKICNALINAARNGKQVHVVLELRASFDEEANLEWKKQMEEEGVKVFLGIPHLKVHAKICLIKKQVGNRTERYGFIGTGNLNEKTALTYTDHCLLTSNQKIMSDIDHIFNFLEKPKASLKQLTACKSLWVSPWNMRREIIKKIDHEIKLAKSGEPSKIIVNVNSLSDEKLIKKLYEAADAGVSIHLIVRGVFCGVVDQKRFAQPMTAISIVDEYLEHSRIWFFQNGGQEDIYIASADWMVRNLDFRIEVAVPIWDEEIKEELKHILKTKLGDNVKARLLDGELSNRYFTSGGKRKVRSQVAIYRYLKRKGKVGL